MSSTNFARFRPQLALDLSTVDPLRDVAIVWPGGNTTAVVQRDCSSVENRAELAKEIRSAFSASEPQLPAIEQFCFISAEPGANVRVDMFGGEFCVNAARSAIGLLYGHKRLDGNIEVSGTSEPLRFSSDGLGGVTLELPPGQPALLERVALGTIVRLEGISHLVVTDPSVMSRGLPRELLASLLSTDKFGLSKESAAGVCFFDVESAKATFAVWVKADRVIVDETACGSGTFAVAAALAPSRSGQFRLDAVQPSGDVISCELEKSASGSVIERATVSGGVRCLYGSDIRSISTPYNTCCR